MARVYTPIQKVLDAATADGVGTSIPVGDFRNVILEVATSGSADMVVKAIGAMGEDSPDFSAVQSITNRWDYIEIADLESGSHYSGDTGWTFSGTDDVKLFELNTNVLDFVNVEVSSYSAGTVTVRIRCVDNE